MTREIIPTTYFTKTRDSLFKKRQLLQEDYDNFIEKLNNNPTLGNEISNTGGVRKVRLKSASKGKRGGLRVFYFYYQIKLGKK